MDCWMLWRTPHCDVPPACVTPPPMLCPTPYRCGHSYLWWSCGEKFIQVTMNIVESFKGCPGFEGWLGCNFLDLFLYILIKTVFLNSLEMLIQGNSCPWNPWKLSFPMNINACSVRETYLVLMTKVLYIKIVYLNNN